MRTANIELTNKDNMKLMARYPDNYFELAIVDPPYGYRTKQTKNINFRQKSKGWNVAPPKQYFDELQRVSKNQIVWGGNYFPYLWKDIQRGFIVWNKDNPVKNFADVELAWTSFDALPEYYYYAWGGLSDGIRGRNKKHKNIHPTQKPVKLYEWLLMQYAKEGDKILDTHLGSGSIAIACHNRGFDLTACELDKEYFYAATKRLDQHRQQIRMFQ
jgi:site-specific DNA-methyltransferase (adenine-specific)